MARFDRMLNLVSVVLMWCAAAMLVAGVLVVNQIIVKRALDMSTTWEFEFTIYMMVSAMFLSSPWTMRSGGHVAIDFVSDILPSAVRRAYQAVIMVITLVIVVYLGFRMFEMAHEAFVTGERSRSLWNPMIWPVYATAPIGLFFTALEVLNRLLQPDTGSQERAH